MTQSRPFRHAMSRDRAAEELEADARSGKLDFDAVHTVLTAAGHQTRPFHPVLPAGLSEREVEVLQQICHGATKKDAAALLKISPATVDHHLRHIYEKVGVATRAGATLFAIENDLL